MGWNPVKEAEKKAKQAVDKIVKPAAKAGESLVKKAGSKAESGVKAVQKKAEDGIRSTGRQVEDGLTKKVPDLITDKLPEALKAMLEKLSQEAMKPGLKAAADAARSSHQRMEKLARYKPELVDAINGYSRSIDLQAVVCFGLDYGNFYDRALEVAGILDRYANEGIKARRRDIIGFFRAAGPDNVRYGAGGELSLGVQIGASYTECMPLALFLEVADEILEELGVPE